MSNRASEDSDNVGSGIRRVPYSEFPVDKPRKKQRVISLDAPAVWVSTPTIPGQIGRPDLCRQKNVTVKIFDLANPEDLAAYNKMESQMILPTNNLMVIAQDMKFCEKSESWKVLVKFSEVEFRDMLPGRGKGKHQQEEDQND